MTEKPAFREWFNLNSDEHREAYLHFRKNGVWPQDQQAIAHIRQCVKSGRHLAR